MGGGLAARGEFFSFRLATLGGLFFCPVQPGQETQASRVSTSTWKYIPER